MGAHQTVNEKFIVVPDFVTSAEARELSLWAEEMSPHFRQNPNGQGRSFRQYSKLPSKNITFEAVKVRLLSLTHPHSVAWQNEPMYECFVGRGLEGSEIHRHRDVAPSWMRHVRFNVLVSQPVSGGEPVIEGTVVPVKECGLWGFVASKCEHWSLPVVGPKHRIVCSYGFLADPETWDAFVGKRSS